MTRTKKERIFIKRYYLVNRRHQLGLSQLDIATIIGMEHPTYNQIENGKLGLLMNAYWLEKLADALQLPVAHVVHFESEYFVEYLKKNNIERNCMN